MYASLEELKLYGQGSQFWRNKTLTPDQILIHDISFDERRKDHEPQLELDGVAPWSALSSTAASSPDSEPTQAPEQYAEKEVPANKREQQKLRDLQHEYGWLRLLRKDVTTEAKGHMCRWIHISSQFTEYLQGVLAGLSDWSTNPEARLESLRQLDRCVYENERFSTHGKQFQTFCHPLVSSTASESSIDESPMMMSLPFLDWTVGQGATPPPRYQIDRRGGYTSARTSAHPARSILQHYYRLEDTSDREKLQVFSRHKPWQSNRETDLKTRRWYGQYPTGLNVDELWVLVVDEGHIVTFSSNQTWKSRHPPQQLSARIAEVSFRNTRNIRSTSSDRKRYNAMAHAITCIHGAVGMLHRSFWPDIKLPCTDRYGSYIGHLQYLLHRTPGTKLVMDLLQVQDELNIVLQVTKKQMEVIHKLRSLLESAHNAYGLDNTNPPRIVLDASSSSHEQPSYLQPPDTSISEQGSYDPFRASPIMPPTKTRYVFRLPSPVDEILDNLKKEYDDLKELRDSSSEMFTRTVQLVNIRIEDHGQAILIFTIVTIIFLPLSFVASFFGMNVSDLRMMAGTQKVFWTFGIVLTLIVVLVSTLLAFYGGHYWDKFRLWRDARANRRRRRKMELRQRESRQNSLASQARSTGSTQPESQGSFSVLEVQRVSV